MDIRLLLALVVAGLFGVMTAEPAKASAVAPTDIPAIVEAAFKQWNVPGAAITVVKDGKVVLARGYGVSSLAKGNAVDERTSFYLASATKAFTATGVQMLADDGRLRLDDRVTKHIAELGTSIDGQFQQLRLLDLLAQRSGFPRADLLSFSGMSRQEMLTRLTKLDPVAPPRWRFTYNNQMYLVLDEISARTSGMRWDSFIESRLLSPLGMNDSNAAGLGHPKDPRNAAAPHATLDGKISNADLVGRNPYGGGAINSTAADMAKWLQFQLGDGSVEGRKLVSPARFAEMQEAQTVVPPNPLAPGAHVVGYGLGWFIHDFNGQKIVQHGGNGEGWTSLVWLVPGSNLGISVMTNMHDSYFPWAVALAVTQAYSGGNTDWVGTIRGGQAKRDAALEARRVNNPPSSPIDAAQWQGVWEDPVYGQLSIVRKGAGYVLSYGPLLRATLTGRGARTATLHWTRSDITAVIGATPARISLDSGEPVLSLAVGGQDLTFRRPR